MNLNNRINGVLHEGFQLEDSDEIVFHKLDGPLDQLS